jgi:hypothetical protein
MDIVFLRTWSRRRSQITNHQSFILHCAKSNSTVKNSFFFCNFEVFSNFGRRSFSMIATYMIWKTRSKKSPRSISSRMPKSSRPDLGYRWNYEYCCEYGMIRAYEQFEKFWLWLDGAWGASFRKAVRASLPFFGWKHSIIPWTVPRTYILRKISIAQWCLEVSARFKISMLYMYLPSRWGFRIFLKITQSLFGDMECNQRSEYPVQWLSVVSVILIVNPLSGWNVTAETTALIRSKTQSGVVRGILSCLFIAL